MAAGDFYKVILRGQFASVETRNEFWYRQTVGTGDATTINLLFQTFVLTAILTITSNQAGYVGVDAYNHNDPFDFQEDTFAVQNGGQVSESLPPFNAVAFSTPRKRIGMRAGQKRFIGVPEGAQVAGTITNAGYLTSCDDVAAILSQTLPDVPTSSNFEPIIVARVNFGTTENPDYRVPAVIPSDGYYQADDWAVKPIVTSQNSRKFGVGI